MLFHNLLERSLGEFADIRPRKASCFEAESPVTAMEVSAATDSPRASRASTFELGLTLPADHPETRPAEQIIIERLSGIRAEPAPAPRIDARTAAVEPTVPVASASRAEEAVMQPPVERRFADGPVRSGDSPPARDRLLIRSEPIERVIDRHSLETRFDALRQEFERERVTVIERAAASDPPQPVAAPSISAAIAPKAASSQAVLTPATQAARPVAGEFRPLMPPAATPDSTPDVHITIGRLEIRTPAVAANSVRSAARDSRPSLAEYLRKREGA